MKVVKLIRYAKAFFKFCSDFRSGTAGFLYANDGTYVDLESRGFIVHMQLAQYDDLNKIGFWDFVNTYGWHDDVVDVDQLGVVLRNSKNWNPAWLRILLKKLNITRKQLEDIIDVNVGEYCDANNAIRIWIYSNTLQAESPSWTQAKLDALNSFVKDHITEINRYTIESADNHVSGGIWELENRIDRLFNPRRYDPREAEQLA